MKTIQLSNEDLARIHGCLLHELEKEQSERAAMVDGMMLSERYRYSGHLIRLLNVFETKLGE